MKKLIPPPRLKGRFPRLGNALGEIGFPSPILGAVPRVGRIISIVGTYKVQDKVGIFLSVQQNQNKPWQQFLPAYRVPGYVHTLVPGTVAA